MKKTNKLDPSDSLKNLNMSHPKKVSILWQCIFSFLPGVNYWASYRVMKLRKFLLLTFALVAANLTVDLLFPFPFSLIVAWAIDIPVTVYYMRKWSIRWNESLDNGITC
jgi:hypothetical protein